MIERPFEQLYCHVPFCRCKCDYCAFYSIADLTHEADYLHRVEQVLAKNELRNLHSIYIGGGTPTLLSVKSLEKLFDLFARYTTLAPDAEISIESNPESLTAAKIALLAERVTRLSMGVQSFSARCRKTLGRNCSDAALGKAFALIGTAKFKHFNCDLIYGIPDQTPQEHLQDVQRLVDYGCDHLSCYALTIEEGTPLAKKAVSLDSELEADLFAQIEALLARQQIYRYEVSNYARIGAQCRHNKEIWGGSTYLGIGPAAASFNGIDRYMQVADVAKWLAGAEVEIDHIEPEARASEIFFMQLRTTAGWSKAAYQKQLESTLSWDYWLAKIAKLAILYPESFDYSDDRIKLTGRGLLIWNNIAEELLW